jgi:ABC-type proline/glycine betaine transport system permease subunit
MAEATSVVVVCVGSGDATVGTAMALASFTGVEEGIAVTVEVGKGVKSGIIEGIVKTIPTVSVVALLR